MVKRERKFDTDRIVCYVKIMGEASKCRKCGRGSRGYFYCASCEDGVTLQINRIKEKLEKIVKKHKKAKKKHNNSK